MPPAHHDDRRASQMALGLKDPAAKHDVLEGEVVRVTYESEHTSFRVLRVEVPGRNLPETVVGTFPAAPPGTRIRAAAETSACVRGPGATPSAVEDLRVQRGDCGAAHPAATTRRSSAARRLLRVGFA